MVIEKYVHLAMLGLVWVFLLSGCSGYGKLRPHAREGMRVGVEELKENWSDYIIHYAEGYGGKPAAIMFDPKEGNKTLVCKKWIKVDDKETLLELLEWIQQSVRYTPRLWRILGPDDEFYGYMLSTRDHVVMKVIGDNTMYVYDLDPPHSGGP
ncbi:MAG: hypothetical protein HWN70_07570 [Desulfobacterales bacterium]|nr:hypothetical protein [Desulfobacterales bacterium]